MSMPKGKKILSGYATVAEDDGGNYRIIADVMTAAGNPMNHASARNYVLRSMKKFAIEIAAAKGDELDEKQLDDLARSPHFQSAICDLIQRAL